MDTSEQLAVSCKQRKYVTNSQDHNTLLTGNTLLAMQRLMLQNSHIMTVCMMHYRLLGGALVALFLRFMLDQLSKPSDGKMYAFGIQTLRCFQNQLQQWPQVCQALVNMPHLQHTHPDIFAAASQAQGLTHTPFAAPASSDIAPLGYAPATPAQPPQGSQADGQQAELSNGTARDAGASSADAVADGERGMHGEAMQEDKVVPQPHAAKPARGGVTPEISAPGPTTQAQVPLLLCTACDQAKGMSVQLHKQAGKVLHLTC